MGSSGNLLIVTIGPLSAIGGRTMLTLDPFSSLASTIGDASSGKKNQKSINNIDF